MDNVDGCMRIVNKQCFFSPTKLKATIAVPVVRKIAHVSNRQTLRFDVNRGAKPPSELKGRDASQWCGWRLQRLIEYVFDVYQVGGRSKV